MREVIGLGKKKEEKGESLEEKAGLVEEKKESRNREENKGMKKKEAKKSSKSSKKWVYFYLFINLYNSLKFNSKAVTGISKSQFCRILGLISPI